MWFRFAARRRRPGASPRAAGGALSGATGDWRCGTCRAIPPGRIGRFDPAVGLLPAGDAICDDDMPEALPRTTCPARMVALAEDWLRRRGAAVSRRAWRASPSSRRSRPPGR